MSAPSAPSRTPAVVGRLGFARPDTVEPDGKRPGLLRAPTIEPAPLDETTLHVEPVAVRDIAASPRPPRLLEAGFESITLPAVDGLRSLLHEVDVAEDLTAAQVRRLRRLLTKGSIRLADGSRLKILHVAGEGIIRRAAGPNGLPLDGAAEQDGATNIHIDQDVLGTPVRQLLRGLGPKLFRHEAPDSSNRRSPVHLVNLWLPLHQITRPLTLLDSRTLDRRRHQLRYHLPMEGIIDERAPDRGVNDIWYCLHDPAQEWWFRSSMGVGDAYVFDTLSTAHVAFHVPGEELAAERHQRLGAAIAALDAGRPAEARALAAAAVNRSGEVGTVALRGAIDGMEAVLDELALRSDDELLQAHPESWRHRARLAQRSVERTSIEVRAVAIRLPGRGRRRDDP